MSARDGGRHDGARTGVEGTADMKNSTKVVIGLILSVCVLLGLALTALLVYQIFVPTRTR
jgi:hypothetical protein